MADAEIRNEIMDTLQAENMRKVVKGALQDDYLKDSPYGSSIEVTQPVSEFKVGDKVSYSVDSGSGTGIVTKVSSTGKTITVKRDSDGREIQYSPTLLTKSSTQAPQQAPKTEPQPSQEELSRQRASVAELLDLMPNSGTHNTKQEEALQQREKDKKASVDIDFSTPTGRTQLAHKSWRQLTEAEKDYVRLTGMDDAQMQVFWDSVDAIQREQFIPTCK